MATQTSLLKFSGKLGDVIGYQVGNKHFVRSMPQEVRQSPRSKVSSRHFGQASKLGAAMRHALHGLLDTGRDSTLVNRLNKALLTVLREDDLHSSKRFIPRHFQGLKGFSFNPHAGLSKLLTVTPAVTRDIHGNIEVSVPAMDSFDGNPKATHLSIKAVAVCIRPGYREAIAAQSEPVLLQAGQPSDAFTLEVPLQPDALSCVILEVTSLVMENGRMYLLENRKFTAAEVIAVLPSKVERPVVTYPRNTEQVQHSNQPLPYLPGLIIHSPQRE